MYVRRDLWRSQSNAWQLVLADSDQGKVMNFFPDL